MSITHPTRPADPIRSGRRQPPSAPSGGAAARTGRIGGGGSSRRTGDLASVPMPMDFPTDAEVRRLAKERHPMSLSLLLATTPAPRMGAQDRERLLALVRDAERRLLDEDDRGGAAQLGRRLREAAVRAASRPTDTGLAVLVTPSEARVFHLRVRPVDRVILDPSFATRDLVRSAAEDPAFLLLVIDGRSARLLEYDQRYVRPVLAHDFPIVRPEVSRRDRGHVGALDGPRREARLAFLRKVDSRLSARLADRALPVVLAASERTSAEFLAITRGRRVSAVLRTGTTGLALTELEARARAALADHVTDRTAAALDTIHVRLRQRRAASGLAEAWAAVLQVDPELLVVERSYAAAVALEGSGFRLADDPEEPGVIDDAVDELIEVVLARGGQVVMVPDGALAHHGRLALAVQGRPVVPAG